MSFLDTAKRVFSGKSEDYYYDDERYEDEDIDEYEEDEPRRSYFSFLGRKSEKYEDVDEQESEEPRSSFASSYASRTSYVSKERSAPINQKSTSFSRPNLSGVEVTVYYPSSFDDSMRIIREVKSNKITLFDVSAIPSDDEARRVVDYIGGAAFGMECPFERLCPSIFCIAPAGVKLDTKKRY